MDTITPYIDPVFDFLKSGFNSINNLPGALLIAVAAAILMQSWKQWLPVSALAVVVQVAVERLAPVLTSHASFQLPQIMEQPFWVQCASRLVGYAIVIAIFFFLKSLVLKRPAAKHAH
ncbi:MAG TPA: hypothetical protein VG841_08900 [Caulobacterales bacterium]|nr:hypothetical protein [Caulobacterales bacterium]